MLAREELLTDITTLLEKIDYHISQPTPVTEEVCMPLILWQMIAEALVALNLDARVIDEVEIEPEIWEEDLRHMNTYTVIVAECYAIFDHRFNLFFTSSYEMIERLQDVASQLEKDKDNE